MSERSWRLLDAAGRPYDSPVPGALGGHRRSRIYGRLDCSCAARALARGGYVANRVFFADEPTAITAGYRPCAVCLPEDHARWKAALGGAEPQPDEDPLRVGQVADDLVQRRRQPADERRDREDVVAARQ